ncbi:MAG: hypothetical protein WBG92_14950 [Thiohalocapsa sp.]
MSYLDQLRALDVDGEFLEMPKSPSVESVETPSEPSLDTLDPDTAPTGHSQKIRGFTIAELCTAASDDWPLLQANPAALDAFALALEIRAQRERGERPEHYTQAVTCNGCGPVWLWEDAPATVAACPWCLNRAGGKPVPVPPELVLEVREQARGKTA